MILMDTPRHQKLDIKHDKAVRLHLQKQHELRASGRDVHKLSTLFEILRAGDRVEEIKFREKDVSIGILDSLSLASMLIGSRIRRVPAARFLHLP